MNIDYKNLFVNPLYNTVVADLLQLSQLTSLSAKTQQAAITDPTVAARLAFMTPFAQLQRHATDAEVIGYLGLLGVADSTVSSSEREVLSILLHLVKLPALLLTLGGDDRLTVNPPHNLNKYLSSPFPRDMLRRGSCTCSTVDTAGQQVVHTAWQQFLQALADQVNSHPDDNLHAFYASHVDSLQQSIIDRLQTLLQVKSSIASIVLFPSGSDAEFLPLILAIITSFNLSQDAARIKVVNVIVAAGEVGSGTANAATGQHFSPIVANARAVKSGASLDELQGAIECIEYKARDAHGLVCLEEEKMVKELSARLDSDPFCVAVLHVVLGSKTGLICPSQASVDRLQAAYKDRLIVVVDACQLRCQLSCIADYVQGNSNSKHSTGTSAHGGALCLITGSKFFTGPAFSGAVVLPAAHAQTIEAHLLAAANGQVPCLVPAGLADYLTSAEVPASMPALKAQLRQAGLSLSAPWGNIGLHLRWVVAVEMMEQYAALLQRGDAVKVFTAAYLGRLVQQVKKRAPFLRLIADPSVHGYTENMAEVNSIVSIALRTIDKSSTDGLHLRDLSAVEVKDFPHKYMTQHYAGQHANVTLLNRCKVMLGQPVKLSDSCTILRIALGADMVIHALGHLQQAGHGWTDRDIAHSIHSAFASYGHSSLDYLHNQHAVSPHRLLAAASSAVDSQLVQRIHELLAEDDLMLDKMTMLARDFASFQSSYFTDAQLPAPTAPAAPASDAVSAPLQQKYELLAEHLHLFAVPMQHADRFPVDKLPTILSQLSQQGDLQNTLLLYDLDSLSSRAGDLQQAFAAALPVYEHEHAFAVKACPVSSFLQMLSHQHGMGGECASILEVKHCLSLGIPGHRVIYDSPCKCDADLLFALLHGVTINCNSYKEVYRMAAMRSYLLSSQQLNSTSKIGLRINPLVGSGQISQLSTATMSSKFGVPLLHWTTLAQLNSKLTAAEMAAVMLNDPEVRKILACYEAFPFLTGIMCHVGSQGMHLDVMLLGVQRLVYVADLIDLQCAHALKLDLREQVDAHLANASGPSQQAAVASVLCSCSPRIAYLDIGGGLSANYLSDLPGISFADYAQGIAMHCSNLQPADLPVALLKISIPVPKKTRKMMTEFGKAIITKAAVLVSKVEDVFVHQLGEQQAVSTAVIHAGADLLLRTAYVPEQFPHRLSLLDRHFLPVGGADQDLGSSSSLSLPFHPILTAGTIRRPSQMVNVVGPLCFSGDVLAKNLLAPEFVHGDYVVLHDTGANCLSLFSKHCSRPSPAVIAFRTIRMHVTGSEQQQQQQQEEEVLVTERLREEETDQQVLGFWG